MRYFFLMLVFLLVSFGLTFSVLMSPISSEKLNLVSLVTDTNGQVANSEVQVFGSLEVGGWTLGSSKLHAAQSVRHHLQQ